MFTIILRRWIKQKKTGHPLGVHFMYFLHTTDTFFLADRFWTQEENIEEQAGSIYVFRSQSLSQSSHWSSPRPQRQINCSHFVNVTAPRVNGTDCYLSISIRFALQDILPKITQASPSPNWKQENFTERIYVALFLRILHSISRR